MRLLSPSSPPDESVRLADRTGDKQKKALRLFKQLEFLVVGRALRLPVQVGQANNKKASDALALQFHVRALLRPLGAHTLAREVRVEWNPRLKTCAGRADYREKLISLNPLLLDHELLSVNRHSGSEIDRTLRHELAHLVAQWRIGRRRIGPHGPEWREACRDLGIADEARCHNLPFAARTFPPRYVYVCPNCKEKFPRVRRIRRAIACLACCRKHNGSDFDPRFRLKLTKTL